MTVSYFDSRSLCTMSCTLASNCADAVAGQFDAISAKHAIQTMLDSAALQKHLLTALCSQLLIIYFLVQLNVLLLVAQSKFKPSKREIRLRSRISFLIYSAGAVVDAVS